MDIFLHNLWRDVCGLPELPVELEDYASLARSEWSPRFERLMRNRLIVGASRYGKLNSPDKPTWNRISRIELECKLYRHDGNDERLVDIANMALLEFEEGIHQKKHFASSDDALHTEVR